MAITDSPLKQGAKALGGMYVQGAKDFGNRVGGYVDTVSSAFKKVRETRNPELVNQSAQRTQGNAGTSSNSTGIADASGTGANTSTPVFKPIDFSKPSINAVASPQDQKVFADATSTNNIGISKGSGGSFQYAQDSSGNILKRDMSSGSINKLGNTVSTIGPNGTNVNGSPLSSKDQAAIDRSSKMIQDWKDYKERKPLQNFINNNLGNPRASAHQLQTAESRLNALDKNKVDREQLGVTLQSNLAKAFMKQQELAQTGKLKLADQAINYAKAREDATANTFKWLTEAKDKGMTNPYSLTKLAKSRGNLTPEVFHYIHGDSLTDVSTPEEYDQWVADNKIPTEDALIGRQLYQ